MSYLMAFKNMFLNARFNRESPGNPWFPATALKEVFADGSVIPEPDFKTFDLRFLRARDPDVDQGDPNAMAQSDGKRRLSAQW
jgi:hypothetical protein